MRMTTGIGALGIVLKDLEKIQEELENRKNQDYPDYKIVKIGLNIQKCPGDTGKLVT